MTAEKERKRRPKPARTGPIRNASTLFRSDFGGAAGSASAPGDTPGAGRSDPFSDAVGRSVKLGYSVIQDQIERGRRTAQQMSGRPSSGRMGDDMGDLSRRVLDFSTDLGALYMDLVDMVARLPQGGVRGREAGPSVGGQRSGHDGAASIAIEVEASGPSRVKLDLEDGASSAELRAHPLLGPDPNAVPLTDVRFEARPTGGATLRIRVPDEQPAGMYTGLVVDERTNEPRGTLTVALKGR